MTVPVEQEEYASWVDRGTRLGLATLAGGFLAYVFEVVEPLIPHAALPKLWHLPVEHYVAQTGSPRGWDWVAQPGWGESLCMIGVAFISLVTLACYLQLVYSYLRAGTRLRAWLAVAQVVVLLAAISGLVAGGH
jgi:hypothetical protein